MQRQLVLQRRAEVGEAALCLGGAFPGVQGVSPSVVSTSDN